MASLIFGSLLRRRTKLERFIGKSAVLGLGFGLGADNFYLKTAAAARLQGLNLGDVWTPSLAKKTVDTYRQANAATKRFWYLLDEATGLRVGRPARAAGEGASDHRRGLRRRPRRPAHAHTTGPRTVLRVRTSGTATGSVRGRYTARAFSKTSSSSSRASSRWMLPCD